MPKARSPFLSSLSGSLRGGPTFRNTTQTDAITMQTRPVPTDRRTAKQAAVRNAYSRLAYLWKNLSHLDKEPYELLAEKRNLTPWNCWLSFHLPLMRLTPAFYFPLSEGAGTTVQNFAIDGEAAIINGAIWETINDFPTLKFDGIDDRATVPTVDKPQFRDNMSLFLVLRTPSAFTSYVRPVSNRGSDSIPGGFSLNINATGYPIFGWKSTNFQNYKNPTFALSPNTLYSIGIIKTGKVTTFYANGRTENQTASEPEILPTTRKLSIGAADGPAYAFKNYLYLTAGFTRALTLSDLAALDAYYRPFFT